MARRESSGDNEARIARSLREHDEALRAFVRTRVRSAEVEDVLQTAALRAIENAGTLIDASRVLPWLYRIHRNVIIDSMRERARSARLLPWDMDELAGDPVREEPTICRCSVSQLKRLRPSYASMLDLVDVGGSSLSEAAKALGISIQNATVRLHRARKALRKVMLEHCGVTSVRECLDCRCAESGCCAV